MQPLYKATLRLLGWKAYRILLKLWRTYPLEGWINFWPEVFKRRKKKGKKKNTKPSLQKLGQNTRVSKKELWASFVTSSHLWKDQALGKALYVFSTPSGGKSNRDSGNRPTSAENSSLLFYRFCDALYKIWHVHPMGWGCHWVQTFTVWNTLWPAGGEE